MSQAIANRQRLVAILAADGAGYSRLMNLDESLALAALDAARAIFKARIESNGGRVIDMAGDSVLAIFETAAGAVSASLAIQAEIETLVAGAPSDRQMRFRIGVHMGDVIEKPDGTVYGDGVNVAARIQTLAEPGGVTVSQAVQGAVRNRVAARFEDGGEHKIKNIPAPVRIFRVIASTSASVNRRPSIFIGALQSMRPYWALACIFLVVLAVLGAWSTGQFQAAAKPATKQASDAPITMSLAIGSFNAAAQDAVAIRIGQTLGRELASTLGVVGRSVKVISIAANPDLASSVEVRDAARRNGARYVVEGDVKGGADRTSISMRLVDTKDSAQVWSGRFELPNDNPALSGSASGRKVVSGLVQGIEGAETKRVLSKPSDQLDAMELVLRGYAAWGPASSLANAREVRKFADAAVRLDPHLVPALLLTVGVVDYLHDVDPQTDRDRFARETDEFSARAVAIEPDNSSAWGGRAVAMLHLGNWNASREASERATKLDPYSSRVYSDQAWFMNMLARPADALVLTDKALQLDPSNPGWTLSVACEAHLLLGQPQKAVETCERSSALIAPDIRPDLFLAAAYANVGDMPRASAALKTLLKAVPGYTIAQLKAKRYSDHPEYQKLAERYWYEGLRKAGLPER